MVGSTFNLLNAMLWLVALYLIVKNYTGFTSAIKTTAGAWNASLKTLQGR